MRPARPQHGHRGGDHRPAKPVAESLRFPEPRAERLIGSTKRECLDHVIVLGEAHLRRVLRSYFDYYLRWRTHLSLKMDCPQA